MFIYNRGCSNNVSNKSTIEKFSESDKITFINNGLYEIFSDNFLVKYNLESFILKSGNNYEATIEKIDKDNEIKDGKLTYESFKNNNFTLTLNYNTIAEDETIDNTLTLNLTLVNKKLGIYSIVNAPRRFIRSYHNKENKNIAFLVIFKFEPTVQTSSFDLVNIDDMTISEFINQKKLKAYMIIKLEYKPSYMLLIFLLVFFLVLGIIIYLTKI